MTKAAPTKFSAVIPLELEHEVASFRCGNLEIDQFLHGQARLEQSLGLNQIYVTVGADRQVLGYFTLSPLTVRLEPALLKAMGVAVAPYPSIGGFLLGRLGVHINLQHQGIGEALVLRATQIAKQEAEVVGGVFLAVDPKTEALAQWYEKQDFTRLGPRTHRLFLSLRHVP